MTVLELNQLPYITVNIERILRYLESSSTEPAWFATAGDADPLPGILEQELPDLMAEYRRLMGYIDCITDPKMKRIFELRFIERQSLKEIGSQFGILSGTLKQQIYSYLRLNPEGYYSCKELSELWNLNINTINNWCRKGLLPGAKKRGQQRWIIPRNVVRPKNRLYKGK